MAEHYLRIFSYAAVAHNDVKTDCIDYCNVYNCLRKKNSFFQKCNRLYSDMFHLPQRNPLLHLSSVVDRFFNRGEREWQRVSLSSVSVFLLNRKRYFSNKKILNEQYSFLL